MCLLLPNYVEKSLNMIFICILNKMFHFSVTIYGMLLSYLSSQISDLNLKFIS